MIKDYEAKDLYRVWREGALIPAADLNQEMEINEDDSDNIVIEKKPLPQILVPQKALPKIAETVALAGNKTLSLSLKQERNQRLSSAVDSRTSRFKSTYVKVPILSMKKSSVEFQDQESFSEGTSNKPALPPELLDEHPPSSSADDVAAGKVAQVKSGLQIIRHLPSQEVAHSNQLSKKRNKKHLTFTAVSALYMPGIKG
jgi:hypothetical protein